MIEDADKTIASLHAEGVETIVGNAANAEVFAAANAAGARRLILAIPNAFEAGRIVLRARAANPGIDIIARAHSDAEVEHLAGLGANTVIMGEREIARGIVEQVLGGKPLPPLPGDAPDGSRTSRRPSRKRGFRAQPLVSQPPVNMSRIELERRGAGAPTSPGGDDAPDRGRWGFFQRQPNLGAFRLTLRRSLCISLRLDQRCARPLSDRASVARMPCSRQRRYRHALVSGDHEFVPCLRRQCAAGDLLHRRAVVVAEPDARREVGCVADEPGIARLLAGAGLAGRRPGEGRLLRGARLDRAGHHRIHHADDLGSARRADCCCR